MAETNQLIVELKAQTTKFRVELKKVQKELDKVKGKTDKAEDSSKRFRISTAGLRRSLGSLRNNMLLVSFAFGGTIAAVNKLVGAYAEQELAERKLTQALGFTSSTLLTQASALQEVTAFGDEAIIGVQALIAAFTDDEEQIKKLTQTTLDLAAAKGMDLTAAADLVSKSFGSSTNALSRYGIVVEGVEGSTERLEMLTENVAELFGGQAVAQADTLSGSIEQMNNAVGDTAESMGRLLAPAIQSISKGFTSAARNVTEFFTRLSENQLETTIRQLKEMGATAEQIAHLQKQLDIQTAAETLLSVNKDIIKTYEDQIHLTDEQVEATGGYVSMVNNLKETMMTPWLDPKLALSLGIVSHITDKLGITEGEYDKIAGTQVRSLNLSNAQLINSKQLTDLMGDLQLEMSEMLEDGEELSEVEQGRLNQMTKEYRALAELLVLTSKREAAEKAILDIKNDELDVVKDINTEQKKAPSIAEQAAAQKKSFEEFLESQRKKLQSYRTEQLQIKMLQKLYPDLAEKLGLLTDKQIEKNQADADAEKLFEQQEKAHEDWLAAEKAKVDTIEEFSKVMGEKLYQQDLEQELLKEWIENNKELAESLGIVTDATRDQEAADARADRQADKVARTRKQATLQALRDIQTVAGENKKYAAIHKAASISETIINTYSSATKSYDALADIKFIGPALGAAAAAAAIAAGLANLNEIRKAEHGMNEVVDEPTLILAGEAGPEHVGITPLGEGSASAGGIVVNISGNVLTSDWVENDLAENIREAVRRGTDFGIG